MGAVPVRMIRVRDVARVTPRMARVTFSGDGLSDLSGLGTDPVSLFFPKPGDTEPRLPGPDAPDPGTWFREYQALPDSVRPWMRMFNVRGHDGGAGTIDIDFVLHSEPGPAARWAAEAKPGATLAMLGPVPWFGRPVPVAASVGAADWVLLVGDASALPSIGLVLESLPPGKRAVVCVQVADAAEEQELPSHGDVSVHWVHGTGPGVLPAAVRALEFPAGTAYVCLGAEAGDVRELREHLVEERAVPKIAVDFSPYWRSGLTQEDAPTKEDMALSKEQMAHYQALSDQASGEGQAGSGSIFDSMYESNTAPWVIGEPQPVIVQLERDGLIRGSVLDVGTGTGEHTVLLARLGYDALGIDLSRAAIERAEAIAAERGVAARFELADATRLGETGATYDTIVDSALFHLLDPESRARYVDALLAVTRPGALVHVLALSDEGPGYGPEVSEDDIRSAFSGDGWTLDSLTRVTYRGVFGADGSHGELPAWLARIHRT